MIPQQRLIEQSKRRKNNPENTANIVQMPNRTPGLRMTSIRQMARSVTMQVTPHFFASLLYVIGRECPFEYPHILFCYFL